MSNVAKLKKQAAELELKKQFDKALAIYIKLLDSFDENASELDVALFNRVGDLLLRHGNVADAVDYYEQAVDRYADTGFFNNAIALCNKILRHSPGRASVYYKLGKISAQKGFKNDAKVNFLEYADRMQKAGKVDEAFRALKEFADLCPDQDEIRLMLADQLTKADRKTEAIEQLQMLHQRYDADGRVSEAGATAARMHAIDPSIEPRLAGGGSRKSTSGDLVFLDVDLPSPRVSGAYQRPPTPPPATPVRSPNLLPPLTPSASLPLLDDPSSSLPLLEDRPTPTVGNRIPSSSESLPGIMQEPLSDVTRIGEENLGLEKSTPTSSLFGLESTNVMDYDPPTATPPSSPSLIDLESTSLETDEVHPVDRSTAPTHGMRDHSIDADGDLDDMVLPEPTEPTPPASAPSIDFDLSMLTTPALSTTPLAHRPTPNTARNVLEGLPLMDLEVPPVTPVSSPSVWTPPDPVLLSTDLDLLDAATTGEAPPQTDERRRAESTSGDDASIDFETESLMLDDGEPIIVPTPSAARKSTMVAEHSVAMLKATVSAEPGNWSLHRELAEAMLDAGDRDGGIRELELAMAGAERSGDLDLASSLAEEIARLEPESVKHHQKRVEYAFRTNDRSRLIEAYVSLADALLRADQSDKARTVYQRVLDLAPDDVRARAALDATEEPEPEPEPEPPQTSTQWHQSAAMPAAEPTKPVAKSGTAETFVNLGDWLRDSEGPKDTRMIVDEQEPSGDEQADFADMLRKFKQGVAENVDAEDYQSHYDLAIAFKEMGLLDEAISEFQKALGSPTNRLPTYEALGQCFLDKGSFKLASSILGRALNEKGSEEQMLGVYYLLGRAAEAQGNTTDALTYYQRVFVLDIQFRDIADRLNELERAPR